MKLSDVSPKAEPVGWATFIAAVIGVAASYSFNITTELKDLLIQYGPFVIAAVIARFSVYAPDTVRAMKQRRGKVVEYESGHDPFDVPPEQWGKHNPRGGQ